MMRAPDNARFASGILQRGPVGERLSY
jgi:hypothetical protein